MLSRSVTIQEENTMNSGDNSLPPGLSQPGDAGSSLIERQCS
jgi:hypothetical protein